MQTKLTLLTLLLSTSTSLADLILISPRTPIPQSPNANGLLRRQYCPPSYDFCSSFDGETICLAPDEGCCQLDDGTNPYACPLTYPWCCPPDLTTEQLICGSDQSCSGPLVNGPGDAVLPTAATGTGKGVTTTTAVTTTATTRAVTSTLTMPGGGSTITTSSKISGATAGFGEGYKNGLVAAAVAIAAAIA